MSTQDPMGMAEAAGLVGGVAGSTAGIDFTGEIAAAQSAGETIDTRRRRAGFDQPGAGAPMLIPQVPCASQGLGPAIGAGYALEAPGAPRQVASYGTERPVTAPGQLDTGMRPVYAAPEVGGVGFGAHDGQLALRNVFGMAEAAFGAMDGAGAGMDLVVISPDLTPTPAAPAPPVPHKSLLGKWLGKLRGKRALS